MLCFKMIKIIEACSRKSKHLICFSAPFLSWIWGKNSHSIKQQQQHFLSSGAEKPSLTVGCLQSFGTAESARQTLLSPIQYFRYYRWPFVPCSHLACFFLDYWFPRATFKLVYWLICYDTFVLSFSVCCVSHSLPWNSIFAPCAESTDLAVAHLFLSCPVYYLCCMFSLYVCYKYFRVLVLF